MRRLVLLAPLVLLACGESRTDLLDGSVPGGDAGPSDVGPSNDAGPIGDAGPSDTSIPDSGPFDPSCMSCRADGESCELSINCQPGSICNQPTDSLYDPSQPSQICIRVVCTNNNDCAPPKQCSVEGICREPVCQADSDCGQGYTCLDGACALRPGASACRVVPASLILAESQPSERLGAIAYNGGAVVGGISFEWQSTNTNIASIAGDRAVGGATTGEAQLTARIPGTPAITCTGAIDVTSFARPTGADTRIVVADADSGAPIAGATVIAHTGGTPESATSSALGDVIVGASVFLTTVTAPGYSRVSVLGGTLPTETIVRLPRARSWARTHAGGVRGSMATSSLRRGDMIFGLAGTTLKASRPSHGISEVFCRVVDTVIDAPELGLDRQTLELAGGMVWGLGAKQFTDDSAEVGGGLRCQNASPGPSSIGCYVAEGAPGSSAVWSLADRLRLSDVTQVANELNEVFSGQSNSFDPLCSGMAGLLIRRGHYGLDPLVTLGESPKIGDRPDYAQFDLVDSRPSVPLGIATVVSVPPHPDYGNGCDGFTSVLAAVNLPGRGLSPLGLTTGITESDDGTCAPRQPGDPLGGNAEPLADGALALFVAPKSAGSERDPLVLASFVNGGEGTISAQFRHPARIERAETFDQPYPTIAGVTIVRGTRAMSFSPSAAPGNTFRLTIAIDADNEWVVYLPRGFASISLPDTNAGGLPLTNVTSAELELIRVPSSHESLFTLGRDTELSRLFEQIEGFAITPCTTAVGSCRLQ